MDQNEASRQREAVVLNPFTDMKTTFTGEEVYSVTEKGLVIAQKGKTRFFYPWSRVVLFTYHTEDVSARKVIQGY